MKGKVRRALAALLGLLTLSSCGKAAFDPAALAGRYAEGRLEAEYTVATHAGFFAQYRLQSRMEGGASQVTLLEPRSVAGVSAQLRPGEARLIYEDLSLDALLPEAEGFAPMDALHCLMQDLTGLPDSWMEREDAILADYQRPAPQGRVLKRAAFHPESLDLLWAELYLDGSLILTVTMDRFLWEETAG